MIRQRNSKNRSRDWIPDGGIERSTGEFGKGDWFEHESERAARAAAWRRKQRGKHKQRRDERADH